MAISTPQEITKYLKQASELELSVYSQAKAEENARLKLKKPTFKKKSVSYPKEKLRVPEPKKPSRAEPSKTIPAPTLQKKQIDHSLSNTFIGIVLCMMAVGGVVGFKLVITWGILSFLGVVITFLFAAAPVAVLMFIKTAVRARFERRVREEEQRTYHAELEKYKREIAEVEEKAEAEYIARMEVYEKAFAEYTQEKKRVDKINAKRETVAAAEADQVNSALKANVNSLYAEAESMVNGLAKSLHETEAVLEKFYAIDVIFPKYRNMAAMCTMYEYFASGRCTELSGPNGAYNLYESELRQNVIIGQLEKINENLEQIKGNQYCLYQGIMECNQTIQELADETMRMSRTLQKIAKTSAELAQNSANIAENTSTIARNSELTVHYAKINAHCSQIAAKNTEALKYIALING